MASQSDSPRATPVLAASLAHSSLSSASARDEAERHLHWADAGDSQDVERAIAHSLEIDADLGTDGHHDAALDGETVLAITAAKLRIGCCFYEPLEDKLSFLSDQHDSADWDLTRLIVEQLAPDMVITSSTADAGFLEALDAQLSLLPRRSETSSPSSVFGHETGEKTYLEYRPAREFYAGQGKYALSQLEVINGGWFRAADDERDGFGPEEQKRDREGADGLGGRPTKRRRVVNEASEEDDSARRNRELRAEAFLSSLYTNTLTVGCAGALLNHVNKARSSAGELHGRLEVKALELMKLDKIMLVNTEALTSLQVFQDEAHAASGSSATKEGLSLFGIVNVTRTPLGKVLMRQWFIRPALELDVIEARHDAVECFVRDENQPAVDAIQSNFRHIKNLRRVLKALAAGGAPITDWQSAWMFVFGSIQIRDAVLCLEHSVGIEVIDRLLDSFDSLSFMKVGEMINDVIDWQESQLRQGRVCVRPGVDAELDKLRRQLDGLESFLSSVARDVAQDLPQALAKELSLVYFPQLGYLITVAVEPDVTDTGKYGALGWDFQFVTERQAYFKNDKCRDLDRHIGDLQSFISDKEIEISALLQSTLHQFVVDHLAHLAHALVIHVLALEGQMLAAADALAELDCLVALAEASRLYAWTRPVMTENPVCKIIKGRHPLAELCVETFVPNDTSLAGVQEGIKADPDQAAESHPKNDDKRMMIVTGANFSGKSVYLKQVALITYLAHIGCFVPAEDALIGLTDRLMTRISTRESITRGASAFMIDLQQVAFALRNLTPRSLLVLDEFGKGTEANDGAGIFCGVVEYLVALGPASPRTVIATHFQHVFLNGLLSRQLPATLAHMEILVDESSMSTGVSGGSERVERIAYLYRLAPGLALSSHATALAGLFGLPPHVLARAQEVTHAMSTFALDSLALRHEAQMTAAERDELRKAEAIARRFIGLDLSDDGKEEGADGGDREGIEELKDQLRWLLGDQGGADVAGSAE